VVFVFADYKWHVKYKIDVLSKRHAHTYRLLTHPSRMAMLTFNDIKRKIPVMAPPISAAEKEKTLCPCVLYCQKGDERSESGCKSMASIFFSKCRIGVECLTKEGTEFMLTAALVL
jgi:hypothetical protein